MTGLPCLSSTCTVLFQSLLLLSECSRSKEEMLIGPEHCLPFLSGFTWCNSG